MSNPSPDRQRFPTTHWSLVGRAADGTEPLHREALNQLLTLYWRALRTHLISRRRIDPTDADDLVQGFIENKILEKDLVSRADMQRGKFRTLLATALDRYVANQKQRRRANKRAADRAVALGETDPAESRLRVDETFEVAWARDTLSEVLKRMKQECGDSQRDDIWEVFVGRVMGPILDHTEPVSYDHIIEKFGYRSPAQASNALITGKRMFSRKLRQLVAEYATDEESVDEEIGELMQILSRPAK